jgi:hypothetical protein
MPLSARGHADVPDAQPAASISRPLYVRAAQEQHGASAVLALACLVLASCGHASVGQQGTKSSSAAKGPSKPVSATLATQPPGIAPRTCRYQVLCDRRSAMPPSS